MNECYMYVVRLRKLAAVQHDTALSRDSCPRGLLLPHTFPRIAVIQANRQPPS
jgi:hypothetical protein